MDTNDKKISVNKSNDSELKIIREIAESGDDCPVLMLNLNKYREDADFPDGRAYKDYMNVLSDLLPHVGGRIVWRSASLGRAVGEQDVDEILAVWYPSHQAFLDLPIQPGGKENFRLRKICVKSAVIHRCNGALP